MEKFFRVAKAVYTLFFILTIGMLVFALIIYISGGGSVIPFARYFGYIYLAVLLITLVTIIIIVVIALSILIKKEGILKVFKIGGSFFIVGVVISIVLSLIIHKKFFSMDFLFFPISLSILMTSIVFIRKEK